MPIHQKSEKERNFWTKREKATFEWNMKTVATKWNKIKKRIVDTVAKVTRNMFTNTWWELHRRLEFHQENKGMHVGRRGAWWRSLLLQQECSSSPAQPTAGGDSESPYPETQPDDEGRAGMGVPRLQWPWWRLQVLNRYWTERFTASKTWLSIWWTIFVQRFVVTY